MGFPITFPSVGSSGLWNNKESVDVYILCSELVAYVVCVCGLEKCAHLLSAGRSLRISRVTVCGLGTRLCFR